jgi:hypothetical protein
VVCSGRVGEQRRGNPATRSSHKTRHARNSRAAGGGRDGEAHRARHTCEGPDVISKRRAAIEKNEVREDGRRFGSNPVGHRADKSREAFFVGINPTGELITSG